MQKALKEGQQIVLDWTCSECHDIHGGNLLKRTANFALEVTLGPTRPDILLTNADGEPVAVVEIVVTHPLKKENRALTTI